MRWKIFWTATLLVMGAPFVHPFGAVKDPHSPGLHVDDPRAAAILQRACANCHSEATQWPMYSYLPVISWAVEKDVADARRHMNFSQWEKYSPDHRRDLLARIGSEVRGGRMPLPRYRLLHPEARLSNDDIQTIYDWAKAQRRILRDRRE